jgi:hypothetical protein
MDLVNELTYHVKRLRLLQVNLQQTVTHVASVTSEAEGFLAKLQSTCNQEEKIRPILRSESPFIPPCNLPVPPRNLARKKSMIPITVKVDTHCNVKLLADTFYQNAGSSAETKGERE